MTKQQAIDFYKSSSSSNPKLFVYYNGGLWMVMFFSKDYDTLGLSNMAKHELKNVHVSECDPTTAPRYNPEDIVPTLDDCSKQKKWNGALWA